MAVGCPCALISSDRESVIQRCWRGKINPMPALKRRKPVFPLLIAAAMLLIAGIAVLWWDSQQEVILYIGSYEPLEAGSGFYIGPGPAEIIGWVLALLGVGALGVAAGSLLRQLAPFKAWFLVAGLLLAAAGLAAMIWDYNQVRTFGWFAYAPLSKSEFHPASATLILGKLGIAAGTFLAAGYLGLRHSSALTGSAASD